MYPKTTLSPSARYNWPSFAAAGGLPVMSSARLLSPPITAAVIRFRPRCLDIPLLHQIAVGRRRSLSEVERSMASVGTASRRQLDGPCRHHGAVAAHMKGEGTHRRVPSSFAERAVRPWAG